MTVSTAIHSVITALVSMGATALPSVSQYDGPSLSMQPDQDILMWGVRSLVDQDFTQAEASEQEWATLGTNRSKEERFTVYGVYLAWSGGDTISALRSRAITNLTTVETALRADPSLQTTTLALSRLQVFSVRAGQVTTGQQVHVEFGVDIRARI